MIFRNKELVNLTATDGMVFYDKNFYATGETGSSNFVLVSGVNVGGLSIYDGVNWAGIVSDKNMVKLNAELNSL